MITLSLKFSADLKVKDFRL